MQRPSVWVWLGHDDSVPPPVARTLAHAPHHEKHGPMTGTQATGGDLPDCNTVQGTNSPPALFVTAGGQHEGSARPVPFPPGDCLKSRPRTAPEN
ncbi:hypothetical protein F1542_03740 [Komagataeibacter sp. FXV3]|nr:hypothetical protein [Komagataeibacter sp. FXV3]